MVKKSPKIKISEHQIQNAILEYLAFCKIYAWRNNSGVMVSQYKGKERLIRFGKKGSADILGVMQGGRFLAIEVKAKNGKVSESQAQFLEDINAMGGWGFVAYSLDDVISEFKLRTKNE